MKKAVFKVGVDDDGVKKKVMKTIVGLPGVDSVSVDAKDKKLTVVGDIDPVSIVSKLRRLCHTEIVSVGPAKDREKKDDENKKKDDEKKKKDDDETKKKIRELVNSYGAYNVVAAGEKPTADACVIC